MKNIRRRKKARRCNRGWVIFDTELDAKIALAERLRKDKGEVRYYPCPGQDHFHLTAQSEPEDDSELLTSQAAS